MAESDSDEDLKRAIALSLQQFSPGSGNQDHNVIDLASDSEDDDLDAPLRVKPNPHGDGKRKENVAPSMPQSSKHQVVNSVAEPDQTSINDTVSTLPQSNGLLGLDRKAMEAERLARSKSRTSQENATTNQVFKKRKASTSPPATEETPRLDVKALENRVKRQQMQQNSSKVPSAKVPSTKVSGGQHSTGIQFPDGVVKRTWAYGCERTGDDIKIEEVLQKNELKLAVLSAFQVDPDWIQTKLDPKTKVVWVLQAMTEAERQQIRATADANYKFCFPNMEGNINCMHSKLQLLVYASHLRIVVPSANLVPYDWGETGVMENLCFLIDLPRLPPGKQVTLTPFGESLLYFARALGLDASMVEGLTKFDFSRTKELGFVHTIGGFHTGESASKTGYCGLATSVKALGLNTNIPVEVDIIASSIGSLNSLFIENIYKAAQGVNGLGEENVGARTASKIKATGTLIDEGPLSRTRIYFPTRTTVASSKGGTNAGGTICFSSKWFDGADFPRAIMRDSQSSREGMLLHSKAIFCRPKQTGTEHLTAWAYVGSANISESAWGRLVKDRSTKDFKLNCRNWECGVVIPVRTKDIAKKGEFVGWDVFRDRVPIPMVVPGNQYGAERPWFFGGY